MQPAESDFHENVLQLTLKEVFGEIEPEILDWARPRMTISSLTGGETLMRQGDESDCIFFVLSGRLRALMTRGDGERVVLGDIGRGEPIGELGVVTGKPRGATVVALRDSILLRLGAADFATLLQIWPRLGLPFTRKLIQRMSRSNERAVEIRGICSICLIPLHATIDAAGLARRLRDVLAAALTEGQTGLAGGGPPISILDRAAACAALGPGGADITPDAAADHHRQLAWLEQQESRHAMQVLVAESGDTPWTQFCVRHSDHVLMVAEADGDHSITAAEAHLIAGQGLDSAPACSLLLVHPADRRIPRDTQRWLGRRKHLRENGLSHFHARRGHAGDWSRLARILCGKGTGLVFAGGGARGFAHLGVMQALEERGIVWDIVGGTSIGAVMAALAAFDRPVAEVIEVAARAFALKPTSDIAWLPVISFIAGRRLARVIGNAVIDGVGSSIDIEDLWKPYFCIASNYSRARPETLRRGDLASAIVASVSIPAALPPVLRGGDLLVDGGLFNNYPVDVMGRSGAARIIGVDLDSHRNAPLELQRMPTSAGFLFDRFLRKRRHRRYERVPGIGTMVVGMASMSSKQHQRQMRESVDLGFRPDVSGVGMLDWGRLREVVQLGLVHAREVLDGTGTA